MKFYWINRANNAKPDCIMGLTNAASMHSDTVVGGMHLF